MSTNDAREAEAKNEAPSFEWRGHTFTLPAEYSDWSLDLIESLEEGKAAGICRGALGGYQWRIVRSMNLNGADLNELMQRITEALGFNSAGESGAS